MLIRGTGLQYTRALLASMLKQYLLAHFIAEALYKVLHTVAKG